MDAAIYQQLMVSLALGLLVGVQREWTSPHVAGIRTFALITLFGTAAAQIGEVVGGWTVAAGLIAVAALVIVGRWLKFPPSWLEEERSAARGEREASGRREPAVSWEKQGPSSRPMDPESSSVSGNVTGAPDPQPETLDSRLSTLNSSEAGLTTQTAAMVMYLVGASLVVQPMEVGIITGGLVAVLLHWKAPLHAFVERLGEADIRAIIELVLIALVILPVLPDRAFGPYRVLNPFEIWLIVVLICGISVAGYMASRFVGVRAGTLLGGVFGGIISSTATTVSYSRRTRDAPEGAPLAAAAVMIASTIVFIRVAGEVALVAPAIVWKMAPPFATMTGLMGVLSVAAWWFARRSVASGGRESPVSPEKQPAHAGRSPSPTKDPSELKAAIVFGLLYAVVLVAVAAAKEHIGDRGLYAVAALSGLTEMDAITLSTAQMIKAEKLTVEVGWRMILTGALSNLVFKALAVAVLADRALLRRILVLFGLSLVAGLLLLQYWPTVE